jgi:stage V sporulation protein SpoVS
MENSSEARGRRCEVCSLPAKIRTRIEGALAEGQAFSRISRTLTEAPSRDSIRRHVLAGHLPAAVQEVVERAHGLDALAVAGRIADGARRAREAGLEALEAGNVSLALKAIDTEARTLGMLASLGIQREYDADLALGTRDIARAALVAARQHPGVGEAIAAELDRVHRGELADDVRDQIPETKGISA